MSFDYMAYRKKKRSGRYKLNKRTTKALEMIRRFKGSSRISILDVGAADGYMLGRFKESLDTDLCAGIEPSSEFIAAGSGHGHPIVQAVGERIPFGDGIFDVVTAASVIDHMNDPAMFLEEARRVLKKDGIVIITLASPFYDKLAVRMKVKEDDHILHFSQTDLSRILQDAGFNVVNLSRFALPFFGIFLEPLIEKLLIALGLKGFMFYIVAVGQKRDR